jgi:hypothetical protein
MITAIETKTTNEPTNELPTIDDLSNTTGGQYLEPGPGGNSYGPPRGVGPRPEAYGAPRGAGPRPEAYGHSPWGSPWGARAECAPRGWSPWAGFFGFRGFRGPW